VTAKKKPFNVGHLKNLFKARLKKIEEERKNNERFEPLTPMDLMLKGSRFMAIDRAKCEVELAYARLLEIERSR
jgi:hypothetical protein